MHASCVLSEEYKSAFFDARRLAPASSVAGRLASVLLDLSRYAPHAGGQRRSTMALTHEELANLSATSRETVTRVLSRFRREHLIRVDGSSVTILAPERLIQLAP
jgi:CRP/FNR family transcriptional regulator